jgi:hypothetical protein
VGRLETPPPVRRFRREASRVELSDWQAWWKTSGSSELGQILMLWWDPIGVRGVPEAVDEYRAYVGRLGRLLREGAAEDRIAAYLLEVERDAIGLSGRPQRTRLVAEKLAAWYRTATGER